MFFSVITWGFAAVDEAPASVGLANPEAARAPAAAAIATAGGMWMRCEFMALVEQAEAERGRRRRRPRSVPRSSADDEPRAGDGLEDRGGRERLVERTARRDGLRGHVIDVADRSGVASL